MSSLGCNSNALEVTALHDLLLHLKEKLCKRFTPQALVKERGHPRCEHFDRGRPRSWPTPSLGKKWPFNAV
eukprot:1158077-Pelagomonas_calceolata.AAC.1